MRKLTLTKAVTILVMFTVSLTIFATETGGKYDELKERIRPQIRKMMRKNKITGLTLALVDGDKTVWVEGFGFADMTKRISVNDETVFPIASISKTFTAIAIMQLVEQGLVDLDAPLTDYIPEFSIKSRFENARAITIRDLLTHHSGLPCSIQYPESEPLSEAAIERYHNFEERVLDFLAGEHLVAAPGTMHSYSNLGYDLLGVVIERVSESTLDEYMTEHIFSPLEMNSSVKHIFMRDDLGEKVALPHSQGKAADKLLLHGIGCGGVNADSPAMANYIKMLLGKGSYNGQQILTEDSLETMLTVQNANLTADRGHEMGLGFYLNNPDFDYAGGFYGHTGGLPSYASDLIVLPEQGLGLYVAINSPLYSFYLYDMSYQLLTEAASIKNGVRPATEKKARTVAMSEEEAGSFTGLYVTSRFGPVEVKSAGKRLFLHWLQYGAKIELKMLDSGWLRMVSPFADHRRSLMKVVTAGNRRYIYMRAPSLGQYMGVEQERIELAAHWQERTGEYRVVEGEQAIPGYSEQQFRLDAKDGILTLSIPMQASRMLIPLNDEECVTAGIGWASGESVYFEEKDGKTIIKWAGYTLERVE